ncbi:peroxiredoxin family protein [Marinomonas posidonica]|uniref:thioredoxin-dependent peroxiredoxin n=1 Tax=Marinomonas posidonica (strain CECT 7376 / NCIMB 14433 / IVIA-Po-181) TaxID=491952 RepID=F6CWM7_MARPP|nr:peroxiredoxin family protein [Marinomonas posidonica]AEF54377.1 alkyl hydroperoxide reductase/ Thiol specific antioxidant/ Mal allergen [Marinomonas posidonica IVIA-Po-181]
MNIIALSASLFGFVFTFATIVLYFRTIPRGKVPKKVTGLATRLVLGVSASATGIILGATGVSSAGWIVNLPAGLSIFFGSIILYFLSQRKTPLGDIKVKVGDKLLPFTATTSNGNDFSSDEFQGRRVLLKFYRGGWCPYCVAELAAFNKMIPEFEQFNISIYALSKDTPQEAAVHKVRDGLDISLLSDPQLEVIRSYGVEHHKTLGQTKNPTSTLGGLALGFAPFEFAAMAIPTTLLIDEAGVIRWVDQSDDIRVRSSVDRIMDSIKSAFEDDDTTNLQETA